MLSPRFKAICAGRIKLLARTGIRAVVAFHGAALTHVNDTKGNVEPIYGRNALRDVRKALRNYRSLYGNLRVPAEFAIPYGSDYWPESMWGMKLGSIIGEIRRKGANHFEDGMKLERGRFDSGPPLPTGRGSDWSSIKRALALYKRMHGDMNVAPDFVIPRHSRRLWSLGEIDRHPSSVLHQHDTEGDPFWDHLEREMRMTKSIGFENVRLALEVYNRLYGNMHVPRSFVVPHHSRDWPEELSGMRLGHIVRGIRTKGLFAEHREELEAMHFDVSPIDPSLPPVDHKWDRVKKALETYRKLHGNLNVPPTFTVPHDYAKWADEELWGLRLGAIIRDIRYLGAYGEHRAELEVMGFEYHPHTAGAGFGWYRVKGALLRYKALHGHLRIPASFVVPRGSEEWPRDLWGLHLGNVIQCMRENKCYTEHREELEALVFEYVPPSTSGTLVGKQKVMDPLLNGTTSSVPSKEPHEHSPKYEQMEPMLLHHGSLQQRQQQQTKHPTDESDTGTAVWPADLWGMRLGSIVSTLRARADYMAVHRRQLEAMGFSFSTPSTKHHQIQSVDAAIAQANRRAEALTGEQGATHKRVHLSAQEETLSWPLIRRALENYRELHGGSVDTVPETYVVPHYDSRHWPHEEVWGLRLGAIVKGMQERSHFAGHKDELAELGFAAHHV